MGLERGKRIAGLERGTKDVPSDCMLLKTIK